MKTYLEIAVNVPSVMDVFHYHLPKALEGQVEVGHLVEVPFGRQRVQGVVLRFVSSPAVAETREVLGVVDEKAVLTKAQLQLAENLAKDSLYPISAWIRLMLPPGLGQQADLLYQLGREIATLKGQIPGKLSPLQVRLIKPVSYTHLTLPTKRIV